MKTLSAGPEKDARKDSFEAMNPDKGTEEGDEEEKHFLAEDHAKADGIEPYTADEDREVLRKLDRRLVLFMALLYILSFLDRSSMHLSAQHCENCLL